MPRGNFDPAANRLMSKVRASVRMAVQSLGFEVRRIQPDPPAPEPPYLHELPEVALYESIESPSAPAKSFKVPLDSVVDYRGFGFGSSAWHPYVSVSRVVGQDGMQAGRELLYRFYDKHKPKTAADAIFGFEDWPALFHAAPPFLYYLAPWRALYPEDILRSVPRWVKRDAQEHGIIRDLKEGWFPHYGPVHEEVAEGELRRLQAIHESISRNGYDRRHGDCHFVVLRRNDDYRFIVDGGGIHRTAAMAANGYTWVPGTFHLRPVIIDRRDVDAWPQVWRGVWGRSQALAYFDYLFDYDSSTWARENGFL